MVRTLERTPSLGDVLMQAVLEMVRSDGLRPGDRLPAIKTLAERFGVSVPTLREAMQRLANLGVVDIRHGSGMYLLQTRLPVITGHPDAAPRDERTLCDLLDARLAIEPLLARRAAQHITSDQAESLRTAIETAARALSAEGAPPQVSQSQANMNIHARIAEAAGNPILADTILSLIRVYGAEQKRLLAMQGAEARQHNHADHVALAEAILSRDPDRAEAAMRRHLERVLESLHRSLSPHKAR
ncbi:FadR family transcriptional regulator [Pseudooceanicola sp. CBS1P-1]|uniref:FCD domain-containing protein n=1 Tax=Pseudooceanicola albus TaxID=2692189 RepID=A0A6L7GBH8_9RHOB|nr:MULTISPECIES: FadR/GntR family transcriptional regulator [Pseudooceanicola]MBT9386894.1 FadR family transcriptional regulator [Pseudooceanicola endophyticus]MXN21052.1 FCD domain-containing protein [Pseudooceanicola albus]